MKCPICNHTKKLTQHHVIPRSVLKQLSFKFANNPTIYICRDCHDIYENKRKCENGHKHQLLNSYFKYFETATIDLKIELGYKILKLCNLSILTDEDMTNPNLIHKFQLDMQPFELLLYWCTDFCTKTNFWMLPRELFIVFTFNNYVKQT